MSEQKQINNFISWNFLFKNHKLIAKSNSRNTINWIVDPFTQVKSAEHIAKNQIQMHVFWFFFHDDVKCRNTSMKPYKYKNFLLKTYFCWPHSTECTSSSETREENQVEFLERQFHSEKLSCVHKTENRVFFRTFSFPLCLLSACFQFWYAEL